MQPQLSYKNFVHAETKSNGVATFQFPASATKIKITASRSGYLSATYSLKRLSSPSNDFSIVLTLREKGVVITACVISESGLPSSNIFARIFSTDHQRIPALKKAFSTNIYDSEIVFDPIPVGLKNLCVSLKCDDMSECFSEVFDTIDEEEVPVEKYDLQTKVITSDSQKTKNIKIDHKGEEWMLINIDNKFCHPKAEVSFAAITTTGESKESKTVKLCGSSTHGKVSGEHRLNF